MLLQFSVANYRSYKDRAVLSMEASADKMLPDNFTRIGNEKVLKTAAVFGANASGKSNLFLALTTAIINIRRSNEMQVGQPLFNITPFMFDEKTQKEPSEFEFVYLQDGIKYVYGFSATSMEVIKEYLYAYNTSKPSTIFERDETKEEVYRFTIPAVKRELEPITKKNTKNKLFLSTATQWNSESTRRAFDYFAEGINTYDSDFEAMIPTIGPILEKDQNHAIGDFIIKLLKAADINIESYHFEAREVSLEKMLTALPPQLRNLFRTNVNSGMGNKEYKIETLHLVDGKMFALNMPDESEGTRNLFGIAPILKRAFQETGETICIDEFDKSLHPSLIKYLIDLFNDTSINVKNAQLIISSHADSLLSLDHLRRDQFYFVDKNNETAASELYSLDEFSPRKTENIRNAYMLGRYGAVPVLKEGIDLK